MIAARLGIIFLLLLCGMASMAARAEQSESLTGAEEIIAHADAFGEKKEYTGAVSVLRQALERYPTYPHLYLRLAHWLQLDADAKRQAGDLSGAEETLRQTFDTYGLAMMYLPDAREVRQRANALVANGFPMRLGQYGYLALPGVPVPFTYAISDVQLPLEKRGLQQGLITTSPLPVDQAYRLDPKYGKNGPGNAQGTKYGDFRSVLYAYAYDRNSQQWQLRFRVFWQEAGDAKQERLALAQSTGQMLLRLSGMLQAYMGLSPRFADNGVVNVWLAEQGEPGGESYDNNIYLFKVGVPRSGIEWIRELAHEYGHQTLSPVGGYERPEWSANGFLGERLMLKWLALNPDTVGDTHPWLRPAEISVMNTRRTDTLIRTFADLGPDSPVLRGMDSLAMDAFIGMALYLEQLRGSQYLATVLDEHMMTTPLFTGANGFLQSVEYQEKYVQEPENSSVTLRLRNLPLDLPLWTYLREGAWTGELFGSDLQPGQVNVTVDGKPVEVNASGGFLMPKIAEGWHVLKLTPAQGAYDLEISAIRLVRK